MNKRDDYMPGPAAGAVKLSTVGMPSPEVSDSLVRRADAPERLEYRWGNNDICWELESLDNGTRLRLRHSVERNFISMGAAGWHICLDVLERFLAADLIGRSVAGEAMNFGWLR